MPMYRRSDQLDTNFDSARCHDNMKFTSSYIYLLAGCIVSWKSAK